MRYMGGKAKIAKKIVAAIMADTRLRGYWFEPFVGGGNVIEHAAPHFKKCIGADSHLDLILMWKALGNGWTLPDINRDIYKSLRHAESSALRGFVGFGASFGGKWFGGYGVDLRDGEVWRQSSRAVSRQAKVFRDFGVRFLHAEFGTYDVPPGTIVYCDPPYNGTTGYSTGLFNYKGFYNRLIKWAKSGVVVYVSEYEIPSWVPHHTIWQVEKRMPLNRDSNTRIAVEKLYRVDT